MKWLGKCEGLEKIYICGKFHKLKSWDRLLENNITALTEKHNVSQISGPFLLLFLHPLAVKMYFVELPGMALKDLIISNWAKVFK